MNEPIPAGARHGWKVLSVVLVLIAVFSWYVFPESPAYRVDANTYLAGALSLAQGEGYCYATQIGTPPITHYPPLQSLYLSCWWRANPDFPANVVWLQAGMLLLSLTACTACFGIMRRCQMPLPLAALMTGLMGVSPNWLALVSLLFSDVLFTVLVIGMTWIWWTRGMAHGSARYLLTGLGLAAACLTRTAAVALVAGVVLVMLAQWRKVRARDALAILVPPMLALAWWRTQVAAGYDYGDDWRERFQALGGWIGYLRCAGSNAWALISGNWLGDTLFPALIRLPNMSVFPGSWQPWTAGLSVMITVGLISMVMMGAWRDASPSGRSAAILALVYLAELVLWPFPLGHRAVYLLLPVMIVWGWQGWRTVIARYPGTARLRPILGLWLLLNLLVNLTLSIREQRSYNVSRQLEELRETAIWLNQHVPVELPVAISAEVPLTHLHVFSGRQFLGGDAGFNARQLARSGAQFLVSPGRPLAAWYGVEEGAAVFRSTHGTYVVRPVP